MKDNEFYKFKQLEAIDSILSYSYAYFHRKVCRWYSSTYATPLKDVFLIPLPDLLQHYYEAQYETMAHNDLIDLLIQDHLPELQEQQDQEAQAYADSLIEEQKQTIKKKKEKDKQSQSLDQGEFKIEPINQTFDDDI